MEQARLWQDVEQVEDGCGALLTKHPHRPLHSLQRIN
jgi:hypothetical protein